jgi:predicted TIM-barrel fold metal-dependent hydrolase
MKRLSATVFGVWGLLAVFAGSAAAQGVLVVIDHPHPVPLPRPIIRPRPAPPPPASYKIKEIAVNARLVEDCDRCRPDLLRPFGTVNPMLPDWREDLRRCDEDYQMPGIRLHPSYHGYRLDDPAFAELLTMAEQRRLIVQLAVRIEDLRTQHPLVQVADVDVSPLPELVTARPGLRLVMLNALQTVRGSALASLARAGHVYFELSTLEGIGGTSNLLGQIPAKQILFGSHFPFFVLESALLKLRESKLLPTQTDAITHKNAEGLLKW